MVKINVEIGRKKRKTKKKPTKLGYTNTLGIFIMIFLALGLIGGFYLALQSISTGYTGGLMCWTIVFSPIGTACSVVLARIVDKSRAENTSADGDGIVYATAKANNFGAKDTNKDNSSPSI